VEAIQVSIDGWMERQMWGVCVCVTHIIILSSLKKGRHFVYNVDETWEHYIKWNKLVTKVHKCHLHEIGRVVKIIDAEGRMVITRDWREGGVGNY
jgi:hypothetical protein